MPQDETALADETRFVLGEPMRFSVDLDLDEVAHRRERLLAYAAASRPVIVYRFAIPDGATIAGLGREDVQRDARAQLELMVGLAGGAITKTPGGLAARIPKISATRFETLARPLVAAYLVALELCEADQV